MVPAVQIELIGAAGTVVVAQVMLVQLLVPSAVWFVHTGEFATLTLGVSMLFEQTVRMKGDVVPPEVPTVHAALGVAAELLVVQAVVT